MIEWIIRGGCLVAGLLLGAAVMYLRGQALKASE